MLRSDQVAKLVNSAEWSPVRRDDQVASDRPALAGDDRRVGTCAEPGSSRTAAGLHSGDQEAALYGEPEQVSDLGSDRLRRDADEGVLDLALLDQLRHDRANGVDRDREADPDVPVGAGVAGRDLSVNPDNLAARVDQSATG